jgi:hypothetical protein
VIERRSFEWQLKDVSLSKLNVGDPSLAALALGFINRIRGDVN